MNNLEPIASQLQEEVGKLLLQVQTTRTVDMSVFQTVDLYSRQLARLLKDQELVPKSLLNEIHTAAKVLRSEAPYIKDQGGDLVKMVEQLEMVFDLILRGECLEDRVPGVPRII